MTQRYPIPDLASGQTHSAQTLVRRSRFLATIAHCRSIEEARSFIQATRRQYADATHNCWAFCAGPPGDSARIACHDDGEPHGSAGRPMLAALLHSGVGELVCVVTRYFGGVKLGTAGLRRAYQDAVLTALAGLPLKLHGESTTLNVTVPYPFLAALHRALPLHEAHIQEESFGEGASFLISLPKEQLEPFCHALSEHSAGSIIIRDAAS